MKARLSVVSCATVMVLVSATVSACTGPPSSSVPEVSSPAGTATASGTATGTSTPGNGAATTATSTATHTATTSAPATHSDAATGPPATATTTKPATPASPTTQPATHTESPTVPAGAPETGGGGTAGLQDGLAIGLGLAAILAGLGSLAYRRRLTRRRR